MKTAKLFMGSIVLSFLGVACASQPAPPPAEPVAPAAPPPAEAAPAATPPAEAAPPAPPPPRASSPCRSCRAGRRTSHHRRRDRRQERLQGFGQSRADRDGRR